MDIQSDRDIGCCRECQLVYLALSNSTGNSRVLADVVKALESIRTATYDVTVEMTDSLDGKTSTTRMKAFFEAPSLERLETLAPGDSDKVASVMILDQHVMKGLTLAPEQKMAMLVDLTKIKKPAGKPSNPFDMVREFVREGNGPAVKSLGKKEIDGHEVIGFRTQSNMADTDFWADPQTARLVRVDFEYPGRGSHGVMNHFRYNIELDPKLFSLEPPEGYTVSNVEIAMPVEADLVSTLRMIAEHNDGMFPSAISMTNKDYLHAIQEVSKEEMATFIKQPETQKLMEKLKARICQRSGGVHEGVDGGDHATHTEALAQASARHEFLQHAWRAERLALRRQRRETGHARSADLLVQAHRGREVSRYLR